VAQLLKCIIWVENQLPRCGCHHPVTKGSTKTHQSCWSESQEVAAQWLSTLSARKNKSPKSTIWRQADCLRQSKAKAGHECHCCMYLTVEVWMLPPNNKSTKLQKKVTVEMWTLPPNLVGCSAQNSAEFSVLLRFCRFLSRTSFFAEHFHWQNYLSAWSNVLHMFCQCLCSCKFWHHKNHWQAYTLMAIIEKTYSKYCTSSKLSWKVANLFYNNNKMTINLSLLHSLSSSVAEHVVEFWKSKFYVLASAPSAEQLEHAEHWKSARNLAEFCILLKICYFLKKQVLPECPTKPPNDKSSAEELMVKVWMSLPKWQKCYGKWWPRYGHCHPMTKLQKW